jgi:hypothetical protein
MHDCTSETLTHYCPCGVEHAGSCADYLRSRFPKGSSVRHVRRGLGTVLNLSVDFRYDLAYVNVLYPNGVRDVAPFSSVTPV